MDDTLMDFFSACMAGDKASAKGFLSPSFLSMDGNTVDAWLDEQIFFWTGMGVSDLSGGFSVSSEDIPGSQGLASYLVCSADGRVSHCGTMRADSTGLLGNGFAWQLVGKKRTYSDGRGFISCAVKPSFRLENPGSVEMFLRIPGTPPAKGRFMPHAHNADGFFAFEWPSGDPPPEGLLRVSVHWPGGVERREIFIRDTPPSFPIVSGAVIVRKHPEAMDWSLSAAKSGAPFFHEHAPRAPFHKLPEDSPPPDEVTLVDPCDNEWVSVLP